MISTSTGTFVRLTIEDPRELVFGSAPKPVVCGFGLRVGAGEVYPELNFTLPPMSIDEGTWPAVRDHYSEMGAMIRRAAPRLQLPGLMVEFELLPPMTERPAWGAEITRLLNEDLRSLHETSGIPCALRVTPTDIRDAARPPLLRSGQELDRVLESFECCAASGAHVLSIESVGGKEMHDEALLYGDVEGIIAALGILAPLDMEFLWRHIVRICEGAAVVPGGDSACGFANTAMQLASQGLLPEVLAAVVRAASSVRSLVAFECGALGPSKDCAYEGPVLKAIAGIPISMEGKSATCAHFSPIGNIASAACDLWSNESVQNVRLLSGSAPEAFLESLAYDCRLMNRATATRKTGELQRLLVDSDAMLSPQAAVLTPEATLRIARAIVGERTHYGMTVAAARAAVEIIREAAAHGGMVLARREESWLSRIERTLVSLPDDSSALLESVAERYGHRMLLSSYGL
jgi:methanol---5-hydroxybenzimidazolylcobamide Co-methyltransferase